MVERRTEQAALLVEYDGTALVQRRTEQAALLVEYRPTGPGVHTGTAGSVILVTPSGAAAVAQLYQWSLESARDDDAYQHFGDTWTARQVGVKDVYGSFVGYWDQADTAGQARALSAYAGGSLVGLHLYDAAACSWRGSAYLTEMDQQTPQRGMVSAAFEFDGSGTDWAYYIEGIRH